MTTIKEPGRMTPLLERQGGLWEIRRRLESEWSTSRKTGPAHIDQGPYITISKGLGTDWMGVARRLADHLGWQMFDREILEEISRERHTREAILSKLDEHEVNWIEEALARLVDPGRPAQQEFLDHMARVILALGRRGRAILVGRGANWLLQPACGLRIRMVAPLGARIARVAASEDLPPDKARERIRQDDAARARFIRQAYRREIDDPTGYDLILNVGSLAEDAAAECALAALRSKLGPAPVGH